MPLTYNITSKLLQSVKSCIIVSFLSGYPNPSLVCRSGGGGEVWLAGKHSASARRAIQCCHLVLEKKETTICKQVLRVVQGPTITGTLNYYYWLYNVAMSFGLFLLFSENWFGYIHNPLQSQKGFTLICPRWTASIFTAIGWAIEARAEKFCFPFFYSSRTNHARPFGGIEICKFVYVD